MGIDQSYTSTGVVVIDDVTGIVGAAIISSDPEELMFDRAWHVATAVAALVQKHSPDSIYIEGLAFGMRGSATRDLAGLQYSIYQQIRATKPTIISPTTLKKFATGSGKSDKKAMKASVPDADIDTMKAFQKVNAKQLADLVDAYWLAHYGLKA